MVQDHSQFERRSIADKDFAFRSFRVMLACCFVFVAVAKIQKLIVSPYANSFTLNLAVVVCEILFGLWIFCRINRIQFWFAIVFFTVGATVNLLKWTVGNSDCGCLGSIRVFPLYMALFDLSVVVSLIIFSKKWKNSSGLTDSWPSIIGAAIFGTATLAVGMAVSSEIHSTGLSDLVGDGSIKVETNLKPIVVQDPPRGFKGTRTVTVFNPSFVKEVNLIGFRTACPSYRLSNLPISIPPRRRMDLTLQLNVPRIEQQLVSELSERDSLPFEQRFEIRLIDDRQNENGLFSFLIVIPIQD